MKICKINNYTAPAKDSQGTQRVLEALTKELVSQGHEVSLLINQDSVCEYGRLVQKIPDDTDIVHIHGGFPIEYGIDKDKYRWISTAQGGGVDSPERMREVWKYVNNIVFVSQFCANMYESNCVVYNCAQGSELLYREKKDRYFLWLGGTDWGEQKGLFTSIMLAKKLGLRLKIAGGGTNQNIIADIKRYCDSKIEYLGFVNGAEKANLIADAKALLMLGTIPDACPVTNLEALASGTPIIARRAGAHPEIVSPDVGFVCDTPQDIVRAIVSIGKINPFDCRNKYLFNYRPEIIAKKYVSIYEKVIKLGHV